MMKRIKMLLPFFSRRFWAVGLICVLLPTATHGTVSSTSSSGSCIGPLSLTTGDAANNTTINNDYTVTNNVVTLNADGNYTYNTQTNTQDRSKPSYFGQWLSTGAQVSQNYTQLNMEASGIITQCTTTGTLSVNQGATSANPVSIFQDGSSMVLYPGDFLGYSIGLVSIFGIELLTNLNNATQQSPQNYLLVPSASVGNSINTVTGNAYGAYAAGGNLTFGLYNSAGNWETWTAVPTSAAYTDQNNSALLGLYNNTGVNPYMQPTPPEGVPCILAGCMGGMGYASVTGAEPSGNALGAWLGPNVIVGNYTLGIAKAGCITTADNTDPGNQGQVEIYIGNDDPNKPGMAQGTFFLTGGTYSSSSPASGKIWARIYDAKSYADNTNSYQLTITTRYPTDQRSVANTFVQPIKQTLNAVVATMYANTVQHPYFQNIVRSMVLLYVATTFVLFLLGKIEDTVKNFTIRALKIAIVLALIGPNSWSFFYNTMLGVFIQGQTYLIQVGTGGSPNSQDMFSFIDLSLNLYFTPDLWHRLAGIYNANFSTAGLNSVMVVFYPMLTITWAILLLYASLTYAYNLCMSVLSYMLSLVAISVLLVVSPLFIAFILFTQTRPWFEEYMKLLFMFAMQPVLLFIVLTFINDVVLQIFALAFSYTVCPACVDTLEPFFNSAGLDYIYTPLHSVLCVESYQLQGNFVSTEVYLMTTLAIAFVMVVELMGQAIGFAAMLSGYLTSTDEAAHDLKLAGFDAMASMKGMKQQAESAKVQQKAMSLKK